MITTAELHRLSEEEGLRFDQTDCFRRNAVSGKSNLIQPG